MKKHLSFKSNRAGRSYSNESINIMVLALIGIMLSVAHYVTAEHMERGWYILHLALRRLYFLPVLLAAFFIGKRGALILAIIVTLTYLPHMLFHWSGTLQALSENISDLGLLWIVGLLAGYLTDRLKKSHEEKARLSAVENLSGALGWVLQQMRVDYQAGLGLSRALGRQIEGGGDSRLTAEILEQRLDRFGYHLDSLFNIIGAGDSVHKRKSLLKIIRKSIKSMNGNSHQIKLMKHGRIPDFYMDEEKLTFAFRQLFQAMQSAENVSQQFDVNLRKIDRTAKVEMSFPNVHYDSLSTENNGTDYQLDLALKIIQTHNGETKLFDSNGQLLAIDVSFALN